MSCADDCFLHRYIFKNQMSFFKDFLKDKKHLCSTEDIAMPGLTAHQGLT